MTLRHFISSSNLLTAYHTDNQIIVNLPCKFLGYYIVTYAFVRDYTGTWKAYLQKWPYTSHNFCFIGNFIISKEYNRIIETCSYCKEQITIFYEKRGRELFLEDSLYFRKLQLTYKDIKEMEEKDQRFLQLINETISVYLGNSEMTHTQYIKLCNHLFHFKCSILKSQDLKIFQNYYDLYCEDFEIYEDLKSLKEIILPDLEMFTK
jgi:hypothetical protein